MATTTATNGVGTTATLADRIAARLPEVAPGVRPGRAQLAAVAAAIAAAFRPERIVLFGSRAYGEPDADSDVDLMVVMNTELRQPEQAARIRQSLDLRPSFPLDIIVRYPDQIVLGLAEGDFFIEDVITKGITLYARDGSTVTDTANGGAKRGKCGAGRKEPGAARPKKPKAATRAWLAKADADHSAAQRLGQPPALYELACFHAQQSAEKDLKAFLQECGIRFPRTHELGELADLAVPLLPDLAAHRPDLDWLTEFAVEVRYPGFTAGQAEFERAVRIAEEVRVLVRTGLGLDAADPAQSES